MKKNEPNVNVKLKELEKKIDNLQTSLDQLNSTLHKHIDLIEKVYESLRSPISKIKNFFN